MRRMKNIAMSLGAVWAPQIALAQVHWDNTMQTFVDGRAPDNTPSPYRVDPSLGENVGERTGARDGTRLGKQSAAAPSGSVTSQRRRIASVPKLP